MAIKKISYSDCNEVVFISDVHFGMNTNDMEWVENTVEYFYNFFFPLLRKELVAGKKPVVMCAGDFFQNRQSIDLNVMNAAMDVMDKLKDICPVVMLVGNHDMYKKSDTGITSLRVFENVENVMYIQNDMVVEIGGKTFLMLPWSADVSKTNKTLTKNKDKYDYFVLHTEISGFKYDNGRQIVNGANTNVIEGNRRIISGHIHKRQESDKAIYLGSPYHYRRDDIGNDKGIYILDFGGSEPSWSFILNDYSPKYVFVRYKDIGDKIEAWESVVRNNYCYIELTEEQHKNKKFYNSFLEGLLEFEPRKIEYTQEKKEKVEIENKYTEDTTMEEIFSDKVNDKNLTQDEKNELNRMNAEYIKKASEEPEA